MMIRYGKFQIIPTSMVHLQMRMVAGGSKIYGWDQIGIWNSAKSLRERWISANRRPKRANRAGSLLLFHELLHIWQTETCPKCQVRLILLNIYIYINISICIYIYWLYIYIVCIYIILYYIILYYIILYHIIIYYIILIYINLY